MNIALRTFAALAAVALAVTAPAQKYAKTVWQSTTSGSDNARYAESVQLSGGDVLWIGEREDAGGDYDLWVRRIDTDGNVLWSKTYDKPGVAGSLFCQLAKLGPSGNIVIACDATGNATTYDTYFIKIDADGNKLSENTFDEVDWDLVVGMDIGPSGNVVYTAYQTDPGLYFVTKLDSGLNKDWTVWLGNPAQDFQSPTAPVITANGDILVGGTVYDGIQLDVRLDRLNPAGTSLYSKTYGDGTLGDGSPRVFQSSTGNTYFAYTRKRLEPDQTVRLLQLDQTGSTQWTVSDTEIVAAFLTQLPSGDIIVTGPTFPSAQASSQKFARLTEAGTVVWSNALVSPDIEHNYTRQVIVGPDDLIYTTAHATVLGISGTTWLVNCLTPDGVLVYQWALPYVDDEYNFPNAIVPLSGGAALVGGEAGDVSRDRAHVRRLQAEFNVFPLNATIRLGRLNSGTLLSLIEDDGNVYEVCKFVVPNLTTPPVNVEFDSFVPAGYPAQSLQFKVVSKATTPGLSQNVELWNWTTGTWERSTVTALSTSEKTTVVTASMTDNVQAGTRLVKARLRVSVAGPVATSGWCVQIDQSTWIARP